MVLTDVGHVLITCLARDNTMHTAIAGSLVVV